MFEISNFLNNTQTLKTGRANGFMKTYKFLTLSRLLPPWQTVHAID